MSKPIDAIRGYLLKRGFTYHEMSCPCNNHFKLRTEGKGLFVIYKHSKCRSKNKRHIRCPGEMVYYKDGKPQEKKPLTAIAEKINEWLESKGVN